jgi:serine protease Do
MDSSKLWNQARRWRSVLAIAAAGLLGAGTARALATGAPPAPAAAPPPAASKVTPKTERPPEARALSSAFAATAKALRPSVVRIDVEVGPPRMVQHRRMQQPGPQGPQDFDGIPPMFRRFFDFGGGGGGPDDDGAGPPMPGHGTGSGVIVDAAGDVVTNSHVVENAHKITVTLEGGEEIPAKLVGRDPRTDLALVRLERVPAKLVAARLGNSDQLEVGEWVLAIGSPLGLDQTVTAGIVSGKGHVGRHVQMSGERVRTYIQTDAKINPGNSGGPLVDLEGEVVGINTLINTGPGGAYGFAIPINEVTRVMRTLLADGRVRYPYLGVRVGDVAGMPANEKQKLGANPPEKGAFVSEVTAGSPAASAGLRAGDVITRVDGRAVETGGDVVDAVSSHAIGDKVAVEIVRDGKHQSLRAALAEMPGDDRVASEEAGPVGMALQTLTPDVASSLGLPSATRGAAVTDVITGGAAARAGIKPGDVLVEVDRKPVASAEDAAAALRQQRNGGHLVRVLGENGARFVTVPAA